MAGPGAAHRAWVGRAVRPPCFRRQGRRDEETLRRNPDLRFFNNRRGYCLHEASPGRLEVTYRALPYVTRPGAPREDRGRFVVEAGRPGVVAG